MGLVLLAPAPAKMLPAQPVAIPGYLKMLPRILAGAPVIPACGTCSTITLNCIAPEKHDAIHGRLVHESGKAYREMIFGKIKVDAAKVRVPVLVANGNEDRIIAPALARWTAERYGGELKLFDNHAHWLLEEPGWQAIASDIAAWLETKFVTIRGSVALAGAA
jgi:pimeloyl-ACP methyl ester carboxylesterase